VSATTKYTTARIFSSGIAVRSLSSAHKKAPVGAPGLKSEDEEDKERTNAQDPSMSQDTAEDTTMSIVFISNPDADYKSEVPFCAREGSP
jgi:hypothetical protein